MPKKKNNATFPKATFRADDHTYWLGEEKLISVTQLMAKHGLGTDYSNVAADTLAKKAARGTMIHAEIEAFIKNGEVGFTKEFQDFLVLAEDLGLHGMQSEVIVNSDLVAGTVDIIAKTGEGKLVLVDIKTSAKVDRQAAAWQLSLYKRLSGKKIDSMFVFHLSENARGIEILPIEKKELDKLLEAERNGDFYAKKQLVLADNLLLQCKAAQQTIVYFETQLKEAKEIADAYKKMAYEAMIEQGIKSYETIDKSLLMTVVEPSVKTSIDSKKLKADKPEIFAEYSKSSSVTGYLKITIREGD